MHHVGSASGGDGEDLWYKGKRCNLNFKQVRKIPRKGIDEYFAGSEVRAI